MTRWIVVVTTLAVVAACNQREADHGATGSAAVTPQVAPPAGSAASPAAAKPAAAPAPAAVANDPWAAPPADTSTDLGASTGGRLAKVDPAPSAPAPAGKVDPTTIQQPTAPTVDVKGFATGSGGSADAAPPGFSVTYNASTNPAHEQYRQSMVENHVFDKIAETLNKTVRLPHTVTIETVDCNTTNAFYDPSSNRIIVCYELVDYFVHIFKPHAKTDAELGSSVMGATIFTFYHETGHGLINQFDLPAVGREEDSVDQLATLILIGEGEKGVQMALSGAYWFQLQNQAGDKTPFWNEHSFDEQRFYNIMCLIYGSNPDKYQDFVKDNSLPAERAARCPDEYRKIQHAWERLLEPYLTNGAATNVDYKPSVPPAEAPKDTKTDPWGDGEAGNSTPTTQPDPAWEKEASQHAVPAITCEQVADRAGELIEADAQARAKTPAQQQEVARRLESALPAVKQKLISQCATANWPQASRQCVLDAKALAVATKCN